LFVPLTYPSAAGATGPALAAEVQGTTTALPASAPLAAADPADGRTLPTEASKQVAGKKALLVDDDIRNVFALTAALEQYGVTVVRAEKGKEAIDVLKRSTDIDVVLMDMMMPGLDGYDTVRIIRQEQKCETLPIIAVTAKAMPDDRERCLRAGATDYIAKPVNIDALLTMLCHHLQGQ
jgi:CheY-like chemotaxis protein